MRKQDTQHATTTSILGSRNGRVPRGRVLRGRGSRTYTCSKASNMVTADLSHDAGVGTRMGRGTRNAK